MSATAAFARPAPRRGRNFAGRSATGPANWEDTIRCRGEVVEML